MGKEMKFEEAVALISQMDEDRNGTLELKELLHATLYTTGRVENVFKTWDHAIRCIYDDGPPSTTSSVTNFLAGYVAGRLFRSMRSVSTYDECPSATYHTTPQVFSAVL